MRLCFRTLLAVVVARSPLWLCLLWRFHLGILSIAMSFLMWHFRPHNPSTLVALVFSGLALPTSYIFLSALFSVVHTAPALSRMYLAARYLASACPPYVSWTTFNGYTFNADTFVSAHARATFLRSIAPSMLSVNAQAAILRGRAEFLGTTLRDITDVPSAVPFLPATQFAMVYVPLPLPVSVSMYPPLLALFVQVVDIIQWPFVQIERCVFSPVVGSWNLVFFDTDPTKTQTLVSWPVRRRAVQTAP